MLQKISLSVALACFLFASAGIFAQSSFGQDQNADLQPLQPNGPLGGVTKRITSLESRVTSLEETTKNIQSKLAALENQVAENDEMLQRQIDILNDGFKQVQSKVDTYQVQIDAINDKLNQIATQNGSQFTPSILGNMQRSPQFRTEMGRVVQGSIIVQNWTGYDQHLFINGVRWRAPAGDAFTNIPYGRVTTQLTNFDTPQTWNTRYWTIAGGEPKFFLRIRYDANGQLVSELGSPSSTAPLNGSAPQVSFYP